MCCAARTGILVLELAELTQRVRGRWLHPACHSAIFSARSSLPFEAALDDSGKVEAALIAALLSFMLLQNFDANFTEAVAAGSSMPLLQRGGKSRTPS